MAKIVSVQRTEKGIIVCLLLEQNETSQELLTFARRRRGSKTPPPPVVLQKLLIDLSVEPESPPISSPGPSGDPDPFPRKSPLETDAQEFTARETVFSETGDQGVPRRRTRDARDQQFDDTFVARIRALLPKSVGGRILGASVAGISRAVAGVMGLPLPTVSETMAFARQESVPEIHFRLATSSLGVPILGKALEGALREDLLVSLENKDIGALKGIRDILEATPQLTRPSQLKRDSLDRLAKQFIERLEPD